MFHAIYKELGRSEVYKLKVIFTYKYLIILKLYINHQSSFNIFDFYYCLPKTLKMLKDYLLIKKLPEFTKKLPIV